MLRADGPSCLYVADSWRIKKKVDWLSLSGKSVDKETRLNAGTAFNCHHLWKEKFDNGLFYRFIYFFL